jgi:hypothetical protein
MLEVATCILPLKGREVKQWELLLHLYSLELCVINYRVNCSRRRDDLSEYPESCCISSPLGETYSKAAVDLTVLGKYTAGKLLIYPIWGDIQIKSAL